MLRELEYYEIRYPNPELKKKKQSAAASEKAPNSATQNETTALSDCQNDKTKASWQNPIAEPEK